MATTLIATTHQSDKGQVAQWVNISGVFPFKEDHSQEEKGYQVATSASRNTTNDQSVGCPLIPFLTTIRGQTELTDSPTKVEWKEGIPKSLFQHLCLSRQGVAAQDAFTRRQVCTRVVRVLVSSDKGVLYTFDMLNKKGTLPSFCIFVILWQSYWTEFN